MLTVFDEMSPWSIIDYEKYRTYLELRKQRDKFLKSLNKMRHCDWVIEKKLIEAGGLGQSVYIYPARANGKMETQRKMVEKFLEEGRDVVFVKPGGNPKPDRRDVDRIKEVIIDRDIYCPDPINDRFAKEIGEYIHELTLKYIRKDRENWKPIIRADGYVFSNKYIYDNWLSGQLLNGLFTKGVSDESEKGY